MITALQNLISKGGKFVIFPLLLVIIVAFVLYLAQGTSFFDFFPDPNHQKDEFYGVDMNDPNEIRVLNVQNRIASDLGASIPPLEEDMSKADEQFLQALRGQLQAAFQSGQENIDQSAIQRLFGFIQSWPDLPKNFKAREIARSGAYEPVFSQASIRSMLIMDWIANEWQFLSDEDSHVGIDNGFNRFVRDLAPTLQSDENRTKVLEFVAARQGVPMSYVEYSLYKYFRATQVDRVLSQSGFTLKKEAELDLFRNRFGWKADILALESTELNSSNPDLFSILLVDQPVVDDLIEIKYGKDNSKIVFVDKLIDNNSSEIQVEIGKNTKFTLKNLQKVFASNFDFDSRVVDGLILIKPLSEKLPTSFPEIISQSKAIDIKCVIETELRDFHKENSSDSKFIEPARTFATMINFPTKSFLSLPPPPDEARMRSYFDLNREQFESPPVVPDPDKLIDDGPLGPVGDGDSNKSSEKVNLLPGSISEDNETLEKIISFEDVREEIRLRIIEEDRLDAERDAKDLAREASLNFLDQINSLRDRIKNKYANFKDARNSMELNTLIAETGGVERKISFSLKEMAVQSAILGIERRESERRNNREPLEEVASLNENLYFTRSIRTTRDGFSVFLLDRKTEEKPSQFEDVSFSDLYKGYSDKLNLDSFFSWSDEIVENLKGIEDNETSIKYGRHVSINGKNLQGVESSFNRNGQLLRSRLDKFETEREEISAAERDSNATKIQLARKLELDEMIETLRNDQSELNENRRLAIQLAEACPNLDLGDGWTELERSNDRVVLARLTDVYTLIDQNLDNSDIENRGDELETFRGEVNRDIILRNLLSSQFVNALID